MWNSSHRLWKKTRLGAQAGKNTSPSVIRPENGALTLTEDALAGSTFLAAGTNRDQIADAVVRRAMLVVVAHVRANTE